MSVNFQDTIVCPNTEVTLNATDPNCVQCSWQWENGTVDSVRTLTVSQVSSYSVTLVDGVGCSWSDDIAIGLYAPPVLDLGGDVEICEGDSTTLVAGVAAVQYDWSTGEMASEINVDSAGVYRLVVTDANTCTSVDSLSLIVHPMPEVDLGNDTSFCAGEELVLDAGNPGANYNWFPLGDQQSITAFPPGPFTYAVTVTDANSCTGVDSLSVLEIFTTPQAANVLPECNDLNTTYTVSFEIVDGDPNSYNISGNSGTLNGSTFVSDPIPQGAPFSFIIDDDNACGPSMISGSYDCDCLSDAGVLAPAPVRLCGDEVYIVPHANANLDGDDLLQYVLHDGDATTIGTILLTQDDPILQHQVPLVYGQTYYLAAVVGNADNGQVNWQDGCLSTSNGVAITFYESPIPVVVADLGLRITCTNPSIPLSAVTSQPFGQVTFNWTASNGGNITTDTNLPAIEVNEAGTYQVVITEVNSGCTAEYTTQVDADEGVPDILVKDPDWYTCRDTLITLDATGSSFGPPFSLVWYGGSIEGASDLQVVVDQPGDYTLEIVNTDNGCQVMEIVNVPADTFVPVVDAGGVAYLDCVNEQVILNGSFNPVCSACTFQWNTREGRFVSNENSLNPLVDQEGIYQLSVFNAANGCTDLDEVLVIHDPDVPTQATLETQGPSCFGEQDGRISVEAVEGGLAPYRYALDDNPYTESNEFVALSPGNYRLQLEDAKGCKWDTLLNLPQKEPLTVELGDNQIIDLGESVALYAAVNRTVDSILWNPIELLSCSDCLDPLAAPLHETQFVLTVVDESGCRASDVLLVMVRKDREVFIPSAFSADYDGINDYFTIFAGPSVKKINYLRVFSRWGELLYEGRNFDPNYEPLGWDGTMRGKELDVGVYVYIAEIEFLDGFTQIYRGDVLLTR